MRHEQLKQQESFATVDPVAILGVRDGGKTLSRSRPTAAVPDVPAAIGLMMVGVYVLIVGLFAVTIANAGQSLLAIAIDAVFLAAFFTVPVVFLKLEDDAAKRPTFGRFLSQGMQTYTGHVTGGGALAQMFVVPVCLAFGVLAIGIIASVL